MTTYTYQGSKMLDRWLKTNSMTANAFGLSLKEDPRKIRDLLAGRIRRVDLELALKIERATDGAVAVRMWVPQ